MLQQLRPVSSIKHSDPLTANIRLPVVEDRGVGT